MNGDDELLCCLGRGPVREHGWQNTWLQKAKCAFRKSRAEAKAHHVDWQVLERFKKLKTKCHFTQPALCGVSCSKLEGLCDILTLPLTPV